MFPAKGGYGACRRTIRHDAGRVIRRSRPLCLPSGKDRRRFSADPLGDGNLSVVPMQFYRDRLEINDAGCEEGAFAIGCVPVAGGGSLRGCISWGFH